MSWRASWADVAPWRWTAASMVVCLAILAQFVRIGADWDWLAAMGDEIRATRGVPDGVPFAAADTSGWHNVPVLAQLVASVLHGVGPRAAVLAHVLLLTATFAVLAKAARDRGAGDGYVAGALGLLCLGALPTLGIVRAQTLSLLPFALLLAVIADQARRPDRRIWWSVPLVVVWANLHGAALLGVCVLGAYLVADRMRSRPWESVAVGAAALVALCATPQLWRTPLYYAEVFDNVSAQRGEGLWASPSLGAPFDVLMVTAVVVLGVGLLMSRRQAWEYVACVGLCVATASAARHGVWLLLLLVVLSGRSRGTPSSGGRPEVLAPVLVAALASVVALPLVLVRGDAVLGAPPAVVRKVQETAQGGVVLAPAPLSEALAVAGVRLWAGNPLDAFTHADQAAYLDFLDGGVGARRAVAGSDVVVVQVGSDQESLMSPDRSFARTPCGDGWVCFLRR